MPDILKPWIAVYLIHIAETHGADLAGVPVSSKSQKAQIIRVGAPWPPWLSLTRLRQFLTDASKPGTPWGMLSDGALSLPVKLAKEAVDDDRECALFSVSHLNACQLCLLGSTMSLSPTTAF